MVLSFLPISFFTIHLMRQFVAKSMSLSLKDKIFSESGIFFLCFLVITIILTKKIWLNKLYKGIIFILLSLLPLSLFSFLFLFLYGLNGHIDKTGVLVNLSSQEKILSNKNNLYVFLFDELDYSILYDEKGFVRNEFTNIKKFSDKSANYLNARAPGRATLSSVTQLLMGKKIENIKVCEENLCKKKNEEYVLLDTSENIFRMSQKQGYKTALIGWMHKYCMQYVKNLNYCRSYGIYNYSSFYSEFSLLNPIYTNINLLPNQMPFGLLKNPVSSHMHHMNNKNVHNLSLKIIEKGKGAPTFLFAHFSIPHVPFIYKNKMYQLNNNPFEKNIDSYKEQLIYVDKLFGELIDKIQYENKLNSSTIVLLSDHAYRKISLEDDIYHVPMIIFDGTSPKYKKKINKISTEEILISLIKK